MKHLNLYIKLIKLLTYLDGLKLNKLYIFYIIYKIILFNLGNYNLMYFVII